MGDGGALLGSWRPLPNGGHSQVLPQGPSGCPEALRALLFAEGAGN